MAGAEKTGKKKKYGKWLAAVLLFGGIVLPVKAAPAELVSGSAVVYDRMSEAGAPLQNLVQDGRFEYLGDETAEDGSVWHAVATSTGIFGYIRGDIEIKTLQPGQEQPGETAGNEENNAGQAAHAENGQSAEPAADTENGQPTAAGNPPAENVPAETAENEEGYREGAEETVLPRTIENNRTKSYAAEMLGEKIKGRENGTEEAAEKDRRAQEADSISRRTDRMLILCVIVAVISLAGALIFQRKLGRERGERKKNQFPKKAGKNALRTERKRKKSRRRRNKKHGKRQKSSRAGNNNG